MSLPANFPVSLDALANPTATTNRDDAGFELDLVVSRIHDILEALEAKVGITASVPSAGGGVLRQTGAGLSAWGKLAAVDLADGTSLKQIATTGVLAANQATVTFSSITQGYASLLLIASARSTAAATADNVSLRLNNDVSGPYHAQQVLGQGSAASGIEQFNATYAAVAAVPAASGPASYFAPFVLHVAHYHNTSTTRHFLAENYFLPVGTGSMVTRVVGGVYHSTAAITAITLALTTGGALFAPGSQFDLYGIP